MPSEQIEELVEATPDTPLDAPRSEYPCYVRDIWQESPRYFGLRVEIEESLRADSYRPGQYVTLAPPSIERRFVVIAGSLESASRDVWEFLIDRETTLGGAFESVESGTSLTMTAPEGTGYPVDEVQHRHVLCFTTGSGIASIRPAIQYWRAHPESAPRSLTLYYGESHPDDFAYRAETRDWSHDGIRVYECCEKAPETTEGTFEYVQQAFEAHDPDLEEVSVFLSGASVMKRAVIERLVQRGVPLDVVATNI